MELQDSGFALGYHMQVGADRYIPLCSCLQQRDLHLLHPECRCPFADGIVDAERAAGKFSVCKCKTIHVRKVAQQLPFSRTHHDRDRSDGGKKPGEFLPF